MLLWVVQPGGLGWSVLVCDKVGANDVKVCVGQPATSPCVVRCRDTFLFGVSGVVACDSFILAVACDRFI